MSDRLTVVLDVGKTLAKLSLWTALGEPISKASRRNERIEANGYIALDVEGIDDWIGVTLKSFAEVGPIGAIVPVGHGAAAAIVRGGRLACPPVDYENPVRNAARQDYASQRPSFAETGSPLLPDGLNLGLQLHCLEQMRPGLFSGDAQILLWPQFWAWRLSGVAASEVTSLGCHTDLWNPLKGAPSSLARSRGWADRLPPMSKAEDILGPVSEEWIARCGLPRDAMVYCGLHDSNAALLAARGFAEIANHEATVLSTGTWFVGMRSPGSGASVETLALSETRDCLMNVDVRGAVVPSARFMGGREIEILTGLDLRGVDVKPDQPALLKAAAGVLEEGARLLPTFAPGFGPFPNSRGQWIDMPDDPTARRAAVCIYAALVADISLGLIRAHERILVEGRFAEADLFVRTLAALRPSDAVFVSNAQTNVSYGALRLIDQRLSPAATLTRADPLPTPIGAYQEQWRRDAELMEHVA